MQPAFRSFHKLPQTRLLPGLVQLHLHGDELVIVAGKLGALENLC